VAIGTTKGLFFVSDGAADGPFFRGELVRAFAQMQDRLLAASSDPVAGTSMRVSDDGGMTWDEAGAHPIAFPADAHTELISVWQLHADRRPKATGTIWAGVEPAALFRSDDRDNTFELVRGLFEHPDRPGWIASPSGLSMHTVITHPERPDRIFVAISAGGVYRSDDGGETWKAATRESSQTTVRTTRRSRAHACTSSLSTRQTPPSFGHKAIGASIGQRTPATTGSRSATAPREE
jgi:hypothetical protein